MKPNNALLAFFFFFFALFAFVIRAEFIYDSDGDRLNNGGIYKVSSTDFNGLVVGGGAIIDFERRSCSIAVMLNDEDASLPTKIATTYPRLKYITNDYPLNISFASFPLNKCTHTPSWIVTDDLFGLGDNVTPVMVGKPEEFSVPRSGYFYIKPHKPTDFYKLAFCYDTKTCGYVILKPDDVGIKRLAVSVDRSEKPFVFKFVKATAVDVVSGISMVV